jgi:hypothetical protein
MAEEAAGALVEGPGDMPGAESKAPNPLEELNPLEGCGVCCTAGFWTGLGSKKPPPLRGGDET